MKNKKPFNLMGQLQAMAKPDYDLIWENQNPTQDFPETIIPLTDEQSAKYDRFLVTYKYHKDDPYDQYYCEVVNTLPMDREFITGVAGAHTFTIVDCTAIEEHVSILKRDVQVTTKQNAIRFTDAKYFASYDRIATWNSSLIPCKIYGVKEG